MNCGSLALRACPRVTLQAEPNSGLVECLVVDARRTLQGIVAPEQPELARQVRELDRAVDAE